jgi:hypothetical protein
MGASSLSPTSRPDGPGASGRGQGEPVRVVWPLRRARMSAEPAERTATITHLAAMD